MEIANAQKSENTGAVVTAAGMSSRMGDFKPMLKMGSLSVALRIIANFQQAGVFPIVLVTGYRADELEKHVAGQGVICVRNENYENSEMIDSAAIGLNYIAGKCRRTFITPVDIPLFTVSTVKELMAQNADIVKPVCDGKAGHPVLINCEIIPELLKEGKECGLNKAMARFKDATEYVEVDDEGVLKDADTPEDYRNMVEYHNRQLLRPRVDISLVREGKMLDRDGALLLHLIEYDGNVKSACKKLKISYSKAWNMIAAFEANLGFNLIERCPGGEYGGASRLTERGRKLLYKYETFTAKVRQYADDCFAECFPAKD